MFGTSAISIAFCADGLGFSADGEAKTFPTFESGDAVVIFGLFGAMELHTTLVESSRLFMRWHTYALVGLAKRSANAISAIASGVSQVGGRGIFVGVAVGQTGSAVLDIGASFVGVAIGALGTFFPLGQTSLICETVLIGSTGWLTSGGGWLAFILLADLIYWAIAIAKASDTLAGGSEAFGGGRTTIGVGRTAGLRLTDIILTDLVGRAIGVDQAHNAFFRECIALGCGGGAIGVCRTTGGRLAEVVLADLVGRAIGIG